MEKLDNIEGYDICTSSDKLILSKCTHCNITMKVVASIDDYELDTFWKRLKWLFFGKIFKKLW